MQLVSAITFILRIFDLLYKILGLEEMEVDVLKEMKQKSEEENAGQDLSYSAHLKAFALVLHFKQPTAFNYLARIYNKGWPSLDVIKVIVNLCFLRFC